MTDPSKPQVPNKTAEDVASSPDVPAGWYPTPDGKQRYWDGSRWTNLPWDEADVGTADSSAGAASATVLPGSDGRTGSRARLGLIIAGIVVVVVAVALVVVFAYPTAHKAAATTFTARGTFELIDTDDGGACDPPDGYSDLTVGAQVIISSGGKTLAIGELVGGSPQAGDTTCDFTFAVKDVPLGHKFYGVEISHRGVVQESATDMKDGNVALSVGS